MVIIEQNDWRSKAIFVSIEIMLAGLLFSRLILTLSIGLFLLFTLFHKDIIRQCRSFLQTPLLIFISLLFLIPLLSGFWSSDKIEFAKVMRVKIPFLLLPLAFAGKWNLGEKNWLRLAYFFILLVAVACCVSLLGYALDMDSINESYLRAKTIPTPLNDDHVRFSWLVCTAVLLAFLLITIEINERLRWILGAMIILFVFYLHILSARTGLVLVYCILLSFIFFRISQNRKQTIKIAFLLGVLIIGSWFLLPTLKNRIRYNRYDLMQIRQNSYLSGTSDGNRLMSLKAGWDILKNNPWGIGAGDIRKETNQWYDVHVKEMKETDKIYPSSEWMVYGNMAGWAGILLFTMVMIYPLCIKNIRHRFFWILLNLIAGLSFVIETSLEIQYGVFIYAFIMLWWWKWLKFEK